MPGFIANSAPKNLPKAVANCPLCMLCVKWDILVYGNMALSKRIPAFFHNLLYTAQWISRRGLYHFYSLCNHKLNHF